ncbi:MAG: DNA polymerase I [Rikenellaceae bacterium]
MKRLFLVDAYALIFRYYYAFLGRPMRNRDGFNTSVVFGFAKFLNELLRREKPDLLGVAFDPAGGCFRKDIYPEYKANRSATPEDIIASVPYVKRLIEAMCIPILEVPKFEADDVIGTLSKRGEEAGYEVFMVTPDKDYGQLVTSLCHIYKHKGDTIEIVDSAAIEQKYGIDDPELVRDILAIWGDASDNIPGVMGIGEKGACKLVQEFGSVENILANVEKLKGKQREKIEASAEMMKLSKELATIRTDVPIDLDIESLTICEPKVEQLRELYSQMDFRHLLAELGPAKAAAVTEDIGGLFAQSKSDSADPVDPADSAQSSEKLSPKQQKQAAAMAGQGDLFAMEAVSDEAPTTQITEAATFATAQTTPHTYKLIESTAELKELVAELMKHSEICFDTETTGLDPYNDRLVGISFSSEPHTGYYIAVNEQNEKDIIEVVRPLLEAEQIAKIGQNIKFDLMVMSRSGVEVGGRLIDTMLLHYLIDAESRHNMSALSEQYLNYSPIEIESLIGKGARQITMDMVGVERVAEYAAEDADITLQLKMALCPIVEREGLMELYDTIEEPMIRVLADMEMAGVKIDTNALAEYAKGLNIRLAELSDAIREESGVPNLNINSSIQLGEVLFGQMKITDKPKLTKTKRYSTDEEYLQTFAGKHPIVDKILEYRGVKKLLSTYVEALPLLVNKTSGKIHSSYNQAVTATGRLSSTNPNLQNIPIRDELGRPIRAAFIPSSDDHVILSADYSQVELRIMAHLADDRAMIEAFESGADIHSATAARLFSKSVEEVTSEDRRRAKTANFGIIYGISAFGLAQRLDIPTREAKQIIEDYFESYQGVKRYMDRVVADARGGEYVETLFGRRRYLRDINSRNAVARGVAERNAINAPIQGTAADIMKLAMVGIRREFIAQGIESKMIMQVHDEVVVDTLRSEESRVRAIVVEQMERAAELSVKLLAECGVGGNWLEAH